jgi:hypothetical protein
VDCGVEFGPALPWRAKPGWRWKAAALAPCCSAGGGRRPIGPKVEGNSFQNKK